MTTGAAGAVAHAVRAVTKPGDEVLTIAPFFPEYMHYVNQTGAVLKVVPADTKQFQIHFEEFEKLLTPNTAAVLINTPNNPSGAVYSEETIKTLASILEAKQKNMDMIFLSYPTSHTVILSLMGLRRHMCLPIMIIPCPAILLPSRFLFQGNG